MALWDLAGKAFNVPVYQMLGGGYRDKVRMYTDTTSSNDANEFGKRMKARADKGYTFLKMDFGIEKIQNIPGALIGHIYLKEEFIKLKDAGAVVMIWPVPAVF